jgi:hypothetical protein
MILFLEFHYLLCIVKDRRTKQSLLQATQINDFYQFSSSHHALVGERVSTSL